MEVPVVNGAVTGNLEKDPNDEQNMQTVSRSEDKSMYYFYILTFNI